MQNESIQWYLGGDEKETGQTVSRRSVCVSTAGPDRQPLGVTGWTQGGAPHRGISRLGFAKIGCSRNAKRNWCLEMCGFPPGLLGYSLPWSLLAWQHKGLPRAPLPWLCWGGWCVSVAWTAEEMGSHVLTADGDGRTPLFPLGAPKAQAGVRKPPKCLSDEAIISVPSVVPRCSPAKQCGAGSL